ncbi:MAG: electron transport complex subunit RsxB [Pseudomonadales bacterium]|nr:electron transport complex subunit RsxB [Pseudomonadales bacterium]
MRFTSTPPSLAARVDTVTVAAINRCLPQTQCGRCGYPGCRPYAEAIQQGEAINKCPPGGETSILRLAQLLHQPLIALDPAHGQHEARKIAVIREPECIGCTKCIQACPTDAILGAAGMMHTVIESECTGCDLCLQPCPVDCIDMLPHPERSSHWRWPFPSADQAGGKLA